MVTAIATSIAAAATVTTVLLKIRDNRLRTRALRFQELGVWVIHVKPTRFLEACTAYMDSQQLSVRGSPHVKIIDIDVGGMNFDIPTGVEPGCKQIQIFSHERRVYKKDFDKILVKNW